MQYWKRLLALAILLAPLVGSGHPSLAEEPWKFRATIFVDRTGNDEDEDETEPGSSRDLQLRLGAGLGATRTYDVQGDRKLGLAFDITHERYPENSDSNRFFFNGETRYIVPLDMGALRQFQLGLNLRHADDEDDWVYSRARVDAFLRFQPAKRNSIRVRGRVGYREQNDEHTFSGYDQAEYLFDVMHNWRSVEALWRSTSIFYVEHRQAEKDMYTYDELGVRLIGRRQLTDMTSLVGRSNGFIRDYQDGVREDHRLRGTLGLDFDLGNEAILEAYGGYEQNWSTVAQRQYGGGVFGIKFTKGF